MDVRLIKGARLTGGPLNRDLTTMEAPESEHTPGSPGGGTPYNGLYGEAPPERDILFRLEIYKRVGISLVEVHKGAGKTFI